MSYIQSTIRCNACGKEMNVAFGIVGMSIIAEPPKVCPECNHGTFTRIADGWHANELAPRADPPKERP
jgi:DNA-directed RNA polymerase subunit RPC12/RpoP